MESLSSGTPIIGFDIGGVGEMVHPGLTGILISSINIQTLGNAVTELLLDDRKRSQMSKSCRELALSDYNHKRQANKYLKLYESVINANNK